MTKATLREIGRRVRFQRERRGFTQQALADRIAVHRVSITSIERGYWSPQLSTLYALARVLRVRVGTFLP